MAGERWPEADRDALQLRRFSLLPEPVVAAARPQSRWRFSRPAAAAPAPRPAPELLACPRNCCPTTPRPCWPSPTAMVFIGRSIGAAGRTAGEVVFNTALTGYQEILTDPSYCRQIVTLTYPHIGNYGTNGEDIESARVFAAGLVVKDVPERSVQFPQRRFARRLPAARKHACHRRNRHAPADAAPAQGAQNGCIVALGQGETIAPALVDDAIASARATASMAGLDLAKVVSVREPYDWAQTVRALGRGHDVLKTERFHVVAYDFGVKYNILRMLAARGCRVTVVPAQTPAADVLARKPDGVFLANGPGDPEPCDYAIAATREFIERGVPTFGICLGHQIMALAAGARTYKMKFGHHGANHPVKDLDSGRVSITSQNHGFAVDPKSLPATLRPTHASLFDGTLQGLAHVDKPAFCFQGHPEASPGPHDIGYLFDRFVGLMEHAHAQAQRPPLDPDHRRRADRDRPGVRIRLLRSAQACKGAALEEGYRVILVNSNPATIMTDPEMPPTRPTSSRSRWQRGREDHRQGAAGRGAADDGRPDRAESAPSTCTSTRRAAEVRRRDDRRLNEKAIEKAEDRLKFKDAMDRHRSWRRQEGHRPLARRGARGAAPDPERDRRQRLSDGRAAELHPGRHSAAASPTTPTNSGGDSASGGERPLVKPDQGAPDRGEHRSAGRSSRWRSVRDRKADNCIIVCSIENLDPMGIHTGDFDHGRAGADADGQGIPADVRTRRSQDPARDRRGIIRRLQRAVRDQPARRDGWS